MRAYVCARARVCVRTRERERDGYVSQPVNVKASVRRSLSVCRGVVSSCSRLSPLFFLPIDVIKRVCQSCTEINPRETPSSLPLSRPTCCDADIKHRKIEREGDRATKGEG